MVLIPVENENEKNKVFYTGTLWKPKVKVTVENVKVHRLFWNLWIHVLGVLTFIAVVNKTPVLGHRLYFASV